MKFNRRFSKRYSAIFISLFFVSIFSFAFTKSDVYRELARSQRLINEVYKSLITRYADRLDTEKFTKIVINYLRKALLEGREPNNMPFWCVDASRQKCSVKDEDEWRLQIRNDR